MKLSGRKALVPVVLAWLVLFMIYTSHGNRVRTSQHIELRNSKYRVGQVWAYKTRPGEESSRLYIVRVDSGEKGEPIYSIYLDGISLSNPYVKGGIQRNYPHAPVTAKSLDSSVTKFISVGAKEPAGFAEAYTEWRTEFDKGNAGAFTIPVAEILQSTDDSVQSSAGVAGQSK